ncbi:MAG: hypothetical protein IK138_07985 [Lachnospiraceae bacterium]|nr:hypothetical protein [Lachnospiraceae bacterium]
MKQFRKVFAALLMILSIVLACIGVQAFADESEEKYEPFFAEEDILDAWGSFTQEEQADYAGVYVAEDTVVLRFKEGSDSLENATSRNSKNAKMLVDKEKKLQQSLVIEPATYTYNELKAVYDLLVEKAYSIDGVRSVSLSNKGNCINVGIAANDRTSEIQKELFTMVKDGTEVKNVEEKPVLSFDIISKDDEISYVTSINGNSMLNTTYSYGTMYYSAAVKQYSSTYGDGFITTGHGPAVGDAVKYGSTTIGYVKEVHHDGTDDSAFVKFSGSHNWNSITTRYEEKVSVTPAEGVTIKLRGYVTKPYASAEVLSNTFSYFNQQDGISWTGLIEADYGVSPGDSGGAAYWGTIDGGRTTRVIGVISAASATKTYVVKSSNVRNY